MIPNNYDVDLTRLREIGAAVSSCYDKLFLALNSDNKREMLEHIKSAISDIEDVAIEWGTLDED